MILDRYACVYEVIVNLVKSQLSFISGYNLLYIEIEHSLVIS